MDLLHVLSACILLILLNTAYGQDMDESAIKFQWRPGGGWQPIDPDHGGTGWRPHYGIDECKRYKPCKNGGTCIDYTPGYECVCKIGWEGKNCEKDIRRCDIKPCMNGGRCDRAGNGWKCSCKHGYSGEYCEKGPVGIGCPSITLADGIYDKVNPSNMTWFETPSVTKIGTDGYRILGRNVHMDFVRKHLEEKKNVIIGDDQDPYNKTIKTIKELTISADTVHVKGDVIIRGLKKLTIFSRKISFVKGSRLDLSAPNLNQTLTKPSPGRKGMDGKNGTSGPKVELYADVMEGYVNILTNGADGLRGGNGADSRDEEDIPEPKPNRSGWSLCKDKGLGCERNEYPGIPGAPGIDGQKGGDAGKSGNGGNAGSVIAHVRIVRGSVVIKSCPGIGGQAAKGGEGGAGGEGGQGGHGIKCKVKLCDTVQRRTLFPPPNKNKCTLACRGNGFTDRAPSGKKGKKGSDGLAGTPGSGGDIASYVKLSVLDNSKLAKYPLVLIYLMTRYAEDLIWTNKMESSKNLLNFILKLTEGRADAKQLKTVAKRRLRFLNKKGFDRFGNNELFAPIQTWQLLKKKLITAANRAKAYEDAYNDLSESLQDKLSGLKEMITRKTLLEVRSERERLKGARRVSQSEKRTCVDAIVGLESTMRNTLADIDTQITIAYKKTTFNKGDLYAILQGITGFVKDVKGADLLGAANNVIGMAAHFDSICGTGTLLSLKGKIDKRMKFGRKYAYAALENSDDLDFDTMDITAVPEIMQANLDMKKEELTAELVCMLEERLKPRHTAKLKALIEQFFIAGSARIGLIGKVMDLDNNIGGFNFDIQNLDETAKDIRTLIDGSSIDNSMKERFLDDLLTSYQAIETGFYKRLYQFIKAYEFRSLWNLTDTMTSLQRKASEAARGTKELKGIVELTKALEKVDQIENSGGQCASYMNGEVWIHRWSFDDVKNKQLFTEIHSGAANFTLHISDTCTDCYNVRLLKMYVELYGDNTKTGNYPATVYLQLRHGIASYFHDGNGNIRTFFQEGKKIHDFKTFRFNRYTITDKEKCHEATAINRTSPQSTTYCIPASDERLRAMCCHEFSDSKCEDSLMGNSECKSPFGTYNLRIPIDDTLDCDDDSNKMKSSNCKDFDISQFTKMNVWVKYLYYSENYPTGPNDPRCKDAPVRKAHLQLPNSEV